MTKHLGIVDEVCMGKHQTYFNKNLLFTKFNYLFKTSIYHFSSLPHLIKVLISYYLHGLYENMINDAIQTLLKNPTRWSTNESWHSRAAVKRIRCDYRSLSGKTLAQSINVIHETKHSVTSQGQNKDVQQSDSSRQVELN